MATPRTTAAEDIAAADLSNARRAGRAAADPTSDAARGYAIPPKPVARRVKVRAIADSYGDDNVYHRAGDVFTIDATPRAEVDQRAAAKRTHRHEQLPAAFSEKTMQFVDGRTPEQTTGPQAALDANHAAIAVAKGGAAGDRLRDADDDRLRDADERLRGATGDLDVLGDKG